MEYLLIALVFINIVLVLALLFKKNPEPKVNIDYLATMFDDKLGYANQELKHSFDQQNNQNQQTIINLINQGREVQIKSLNDLSTNLLDRLTNSSKDQNVALEQTRDKIQNQLQRSIDGMSEKNQKSLDDMRQTVDEKLQKTLNDRLTQSFETVNKQLSEVNQGLGQMKDVAASVGDLNKVLSGTKTRGIMGEVMLDQIISDILPVDLYVTQEKIIKGSDVIADFAVKLPGDKDGEFVYLPIDSKFPLDDYRRLEDAYEIGDKTAIDIARKDLLKRVDSFAKDIAKKYVLPPETTNFGIMFVPTEGLFAELARERGFMDDERRNNGILIAGPSTISALLNSLQVGFRTLQIQKGAADIEKTLGAVKKEFGNFAGVLQKAQKNIAAAGKDLDSLVGTRTNQINRALRGIETYDGVDSSSRIGTDDLPQIEE
ncbi:MAG: DNA recombination protein RmuC [Lactobacillaceae bacterium]|jgi:DNA recombination protein RmuC|nr:DNA recombination protein RmuC [Lactobacillaceae bacterium]